MSFNVLYLSCHAILEYDECKLLSEAGYNVRAIGSYTNPHSPADPKRPPIKSMEVNYQHIDLANRFHQDNISDETLEWADAVVCMHMPSWVQCQISKFKRWDKPVIFRSIGQSSPAVEVQLNNFKTQLGDRFKIVKYSDRELLWDNNAGADVIIPFYKDILYGWQAWYTNYSKDVAFCVQAATQRGNHCHFAELEEATRDFTSRSLFGPSNEDWSDLIDVSCPDYKQLLSEFSRHKCFIYSGTVPASYTLSVMEAMFVGIPVLTCSKDVFRSGHEAWIPQDLFEVPDWIPGQTFSNMSELVRFINILRTKHEVASTISEAQNEFAMKHFSKKVVLPKWREFLESL